MLMTVRMAGPADPGGDRVQDIRANRHEGQRLELRKRQRAPLIAKDRELAAKVLGSFAGCHACDDIRVLDRLTALRNRLRGHEADLEEQLATLHREVGELHETLSRIEAAQSTLIDRQAETGTRVRRTQALTARTYERLARWPELIATARAQEGYELAYTDPDPLVSVPIPTYQSPDTLCERALASVQAQTHARWEAIVVGDHCTDDTAERVAALRDERIRFVNLPARENDPEDPWERWAVKGSVPRSVGIGEARGRWIAPLSHDDAWDPNHLELLLGAAREHRAEVAYSRMRGTPADPGTSAVLSGMAEAFPPRYGFGWQAAIFHASLDFLRYDRNCAFASEPNDWNLARRAWEAGVRFHHLPVETVTLFLHDRMAEIAAAQRERGLPPSASAGPT
jgi:hypothetical protein